MVDPAVVNPTLQDVIRLIVPEAALVGVACILFIMSTQRAGRGSAALVALMGIGGAALLHFYATWPDGLIPTVTPAVTDALASFVRVAALAIAAVLVLTSWTETEKHAPDYYACLLVITAAQTARTIPRCRCATSRAGAVSDSQSSVVSHCGSSPRPRPSSRGGASGADRDGPPEANQSSSAGSLWPSSMRIDIPEGYSERRRAAGWNCDRER